MYDIYSYMYYSSIDFEYALVWFGLFGFMAYQPL